MEQQLQDFKEQIIGHEMDVNNVIGEFVGYVDMNDVWIGESFELHIGYTEEGETIFTKEFMIEYDNQESFLITIELMNIELDKAKVVGFHFN